MARVLVAHGPNLSRLGSREPEVYGTATLADIEATLRGRAVASLELSFAQTDDEATLVGLMHDAVDSGTHVIVNPAAFTHYSYALRDACAMVTQAGLFLIEVHLSNPPRAGRISPTVRHQWCCDRCYRWFWTAIIFSSP